jgi:hypothetical protein
MNSLLSIHHKSLNFEGLTAIAVLCERGLWADVDRTVAAEHQMGGWRKCLAQAAERAP